MNFQMSLGLFFNKDIMIATMTPTNGMMKIITYSLTTRVITDHLITMVTIVHLIMMMITIKPILYSPMLLIQSIAEVHHTSIRLMSIMVMHVSM